ncbi:hypothetical protein TNIN_75471 [Trichonephila inaurata madagascariensis]|uniref:Uncharacterized protein n=1 Tax=Trichonephila inaurata madagascariensis TaxID=2747483 RepID=A0A8X6WZ70_9ARAC|nr:hypothetical protein TNIN_75471 [Trichonephila inaurata madagascariensis]
MDWKFHCNHGGTETKNEKPTASELALERKPIFLNSFRNQTEDANQQNPPSSIKSPLSEKFIWKKVSSSSRFAKLFIGLLKNDAFDSLIQSSKEPVPKVADIREMTKISQRMRADASVEVGGRPLQ